MLNSIEAERARNRFTKEQLAKELGISVKTYYNWINEETDIPSTKLEIGRASCRERVCLQV